MKPMLAHHWKDHRKKLQFPCYVQPKLNGIRALYTPLTKFHSRDQIAWYVHVLDHVERDLCVLNAYLGMHLFTLDGEFYLHGKSLQFINGAVAINRKQPTEDTKLIKYNIFDICPDEGDFTFTQRLKVLEKIKDIITFKRLTSLSVVETKMVYSEEEANFWYKSFTDQGYEGMMYRMADAPYGKAESCGNKENRWAYLLKRKNWQDEIFKVVNFEFGEGKYTNKVGALVCVTHDQKYFTVSSGLSDEEREEFINELPKKLKVQFLNYSDDGKPLNPTIEAIYR